MPGRANLTWLKARTHCAACGQLDTWTHRALHCSIYAEVRSKHPEVVQLRIEVPRALARHLLPGCNQFAAQRKHLLLGLPGRALNFQVTSMTEGHDLFSDGSCAYPSIPCLTRAAWAVVSAPHAAVLSSGLVPGLIQNVDRAELLAAYAAVRLTYEFATQAVLWTDSAYVATGVLAMLDAASAIPHETNEDLWQEITDCQSSGP